MEDIKKLIEKQKQESFNDPSRATDADAMGLIVSHYFSYDGLEILRVCYSALEDANFHTENETIAAMIDRLEGQK